MMRLMDMTILVGQMGAFQEPVLSVSSLETETTAFLMHSYAPPIVSGRNSTAYRIRSRMQCAFSGSFDDSASMRTIAPLFSA